MTDELESKKSYRPEGVSESFLAGLKKEGISERLIKTIEATNKRWCHLSCECSVPDCIVRVGADNELGLWLEFQAQQRGFWRRLKFCFNYLLGRNPVWYEVHPTRDSLKELRAYISEYLEVTEK